MDDNIYLCETAVVVGQNFCHKSMACLVLLSDVLSKQIIILIILFLVMVTITMGGITSAGWLDAIQLMAGTVWPT